MRRLDPSLPVVREPARRHEEVHMRMVLERARPRVQDGQNAHLAADPRAIGRLLANSQMRPRRNA